MLDYEACIDYIYKLYDLEWKQNENGHFTSLFVAKP